MTLETFREWVQSVHWQFAYTMITMPHEYTLLHKSDKSLFYEAMRFIAANGQERLFKGKPYTYVDVDGLSYWAMGGVVINRAKYEG